MHSNHLRRLYLAGIGLLLIMLGHGCKRSTPLFQHMSERTTGVDFINQLHESDSLNILTYQYFYNGGGVAAGDLNNDGRTDLFFTGNMVASRLYLNRGDFTFKDITASSHIDTRGKWASGATLVDINEDGWLDIYISLTGPYPADNRHNLLYVNQRNNTFKEEAARYGIDDDGATTHAVFFDYDKDQDLDLYLLTNTSERPGPDVPRIKHRDGRAENTDRLYRNNGDGTFTNVSAMAGILTEGYGLGIAVCDINDDDWPDLYVSNDYLTNDLLWVNQKDGTFRDEISTYLNHQSYYSMGNDVTDFNNDGRPDICTLDMLPADNYREKMMLSSTNKDKFQMTIKRGYDPQFKRNTLQVNTGESTMSDVAPLAGVAATDWSLSALFADYDNDGFKDLYITNGFVKDLTNLDFVNYRSSHQGSFMTETQRNHLLLQQLDAIEPAHLHNYIYRNQGNLHFNDLSEEWGMTLPSFSNGAAFADLDNDGDLDLVVNNINEPALIYQNHTEQESDAHYLRITLKSYKPALTYGAKVLLYSGGQLQYQYASPYRGYISTVEQTLHFGLGGHGKVDSLLVKWPDARITQMKNISPDQTLILDHDQAVSPGTQPVHLAGSARKIFSPVALEPRPAHHENDFDDLKIQRLLPHPVSSGGPGLAVGDVNGDDRDDYYLGGAHMQPGRLFIQQKDGSFIGQGFPDDGEHEDMGALFFDADGDQDNDLLVVSGGAEIAPGTGYYQDRLYINDGKGNFTQDSLALPQLASAGSVVTGADYDKDGDIDLFIGGYSRPGSFPVPSKSYLLRNECSQTGKPGFTDVTDRVAKGLSTPGLIKSALWSDYDNDGKTDLILAGEWMPITFFHHEGDHFVDVTATTGIEEYSGWWNSLTGADMDGDGDIDYIAGNLGLNTHYKADLQEPLRLYYADFDANGSIDPIISGYRNDQEVPLAHRDDLFAQWVAIKRKFGTYDAYARATIEDVLDEDALEKSKILTTTWLASSYLENRGDGKFILHELPREAQASALNGLLIEDFNKDGYLDILASGLAYASEVFSGWSNSGSGYLLLGDGHGHFTCPDLSAGGFRLSGDARGLATLHVGEHLDLLAVQNNDSLLDYTWKQSAGTLLKLRPEDAYAILTYPDGHQERREFYYGTGYLSQSSRMVLIPEGVRNVQVVDYLGQQVDY